MDSIDPLHILTMKLDTLTSRSPTPTTACDSPGSSSRCVSSFTNTHDKLRKRGRTRRRQDSISSSKQGLRHSPASSLSSRERAHKRVRTLSSLCRGNELAGSLKCPDAVEAKFKTSIFTSNKGISPSILGVKARSNSITRTIVSIPVDTSGTTPRRPSNSRSRSHSRNDTPVPQSPKFVDGYRALASDRDICEILRQRIKTPLEVEKKKTPDLKGWQPAWNNACLEKQYENDERALLRRSQSPQAEKTLTEASIPGLQTSAYAWKERSADHIEINLSTTTPAMEQDTNEIRESTVEPQNIQIFERYQESYIAEAVRAPLTKRPMVSSEVSTNVVKDHDTQHTGKNELSVYLHRYDKQATVSPSTAMVRFPMF